MIYIIFKDIISKIFCFIIFIFILSCVLIIVKFFSNNEGVVNILIELLFDKIVPSFKNVTKENAQSFLNELSSIFKDYNKLGKRNKNAIEKGKLGKHFMHLIRLTYMGYDILVNQEVITHREKEHDLLMSIRNNENNEWITQDNHITEKGENLIKERMKILENAKDISKLPDKKDINKIQNILININSFIINQ